MFVQLTKKEIKSVARRTVKSLEEGGYRCCVFGSVACSEWGMDRVAKDVDIVVFGEHHDPEAIKAYLEGVSRRFTLENARDPKNDYKVLYFNLSYHQSQRKRCKVDILVSGPRNLKIPGIPKRKVCYPAGGSYIPVVPFLVLVILKVQGWYDHSTSDKSWYRDKIPQDYRDIEWLLSVLDGSDHLGNFHWLPKWFIEHAEWLVGMYTDEHPHTTSTFKYVGFDV